MDKNLTIRERINKDKRILTMFTLGIMVLITILFKVWTIFGGPPTIACMAPNLMVFFIGIFEPYISSRYNRKTIIILSFFYIILTEILIVLSFNL